MAGEVTNVDAERSFIPVAETFANLVSKRLGVKPRQRERRSVLAEAIHNARLGAERPNDAPLPDRECLSHGDLPTRVGSLFARRSPFLPPYSSGHRNSGLTRMPMPRPRKSCASR